MACGLYPIWRTQHQKKVSWADVAFLESSAPHIAHGLQTARLLGAHASTNEAAPVSALASENESHPSKGTGVVLMDRVGRLVAMDPAAELILSQAATLNGT